MNGNLWLFFIAAMNFFNGPMKAYSLIDNVDHWYNENTFINTKNAIHRFKLWHSLSQWNRFIIRRNLFFVPMYSLMVVHNINQRSSVTFCPCRNELFHCFNERLFIGLMMLIIHIMKIRSLMQRMQFID